MVFELSDAHDPSTGDGYTEVTDAGFMVSGAAGDPTASGGDVAGASLDIAEAGIIISGGDFDDLQNTEVTEWSYDLIIVGVDAFYPENGEGPIGNMFEGSGLARGAGIKISIGPGAGTDRSTPETTVYSDRNRNR